MEFVARLALQFDADLPERTALEIFEKLSASAPDAEIAQTRAGTATYWLGVTSASIEAAGFDATDCIRQASIVAISPSGEVRKPTWPAGISPQNLEIYTVDEDAAAGQAWPTQFVV